MLGRVYEYFLAQFASAEGKKGGQFYTQSCVDRVLVQMLAPYRGRGYDPCCGLGGQGLRTGRARACYPDSSDPAFVMYRVRSVVPSGGWKAKSAPPRKTTFTETS
ncbi:MAG TPA: N-6 DNA methylase [Gaiellaceae bacterium]|nr:N-6 DNA methylase [Gaiellaceae bacterium]